MGRGGPEDPSVLPANTAIPQRVRTESGTPGDRTPTQDPDLAILISHWPELTKEARLAIIGIVRALW